MVVKTLTVNISKSDVTVYVAATVSGLLLLLASRQSIHIWHSAKESCQVSKTGNMSSSADAGLVVTFCLGDEEEVQKLQHMLTSLPAVKRRAN